MGTNAARPDPDFEDCPPDELSLVGQSGAFGLPNLDFAPDPVLQAEGWERRFMADPQRAEEATLLYRELGFEVRIEEVRPVELSEFCGDCALETCRVYVTLYTRKEPQGEAP